VNGFLVADGETVVIRDLVGHSHVIQKDNISKRQKQPFSLMPDPTALGITEQDLANLVGYLLE